MSEGNILFISERIFCSDAPIVRPIVSIIAIDPLETSSVQLQCQIDSYPESIVIWMFQSEPLTNLHSKKYSIRKNGSSLSVLTIESFQSNMDYGSYSCHAQNQLGNHSALIDVRSKGTDRNEKKETFQVHHDHHL